MKKIQIISISIITLFSFFYTEKISKLTLEKNEIYQEISGMKASEYKVYKNIRKESLRDNMTDIEVALTNLGEVATRELTK